MLWAGQVLEIKFQRREQGRKVGVRGRVGG